MKGRIGKYKDKIVVWGDPNLTAKNEINIDSLGGEGQADIPVEYYKVVTSEELHSLIIADIVLQFPCFHLLMKGTSSSDYRLFAGASLMLISAPGDVSVHAQAIRSFKVISRTVDTKGTIREVPSFNNIFDAVESLDNAAEILPLLKKALVPITAEEFYNLDDLS